MQRLLPRSRACRCRQLRTPSGGWCFVLGRTATTRTPLLLLLLLMGMGRGVRPLYMFPRLQGWGMAQAARTIRTGDDTAAGTEVAAAPQEPPSAVSDGVDAITAAGAGMPPYVSILTALDHVSAVKLLERHIRRVCSTQGSIPPAYMLWMYGLLARTDLPVAPDTAS